MKVKLEARVRRVIQAGNLALLTTEWSIVGTEPDGKPINLNGRGTVVLRSQFDGSWLMVIENPWELLNILSLTLTNMKGNVILKQPPS